MWCPNEPRGEGIDDDDDDDDDEIGLFVDSEGGGAF